MRKGVNDNVGFWYKIYDVLNDNLLYYGLVHLLHIQKIFERKQ